MRQQTIHAVKAYLDRAHIRYVCSTSKEESKLILERASQLTPLIETLGLAKDM